MRTDDLIERLGRETSFAKPLPAPGIRTALWLVFAMGYAAVEITMLATISVAEATARPLFVGLQVTALITGILAALGAFLSVIPGQSDRYRPWLAPTIGAAAWVSLLLFASVSDLQSAGTLGTTYSDWPCVVSMTIGGLILGVPLLSMLRRGAPLTPRATAWLAALAAFSLMNTAACLSRPHAFAMTILLWHGGTIALWLALSGLMARHWFRWPATVTR